MSDSPRTDRESLSFDVVIVGGGPAGLSCALRLRQIAPTLSVCVVEKGAEIGAHLLSGACLDPVALQEILPDWKERGAPLETLATHDSFALLTAQHEIPLPVPPQARNAGKNYIISLGQFGQWLAEQAAQAGVEIFPGFAAAEILYDPQGRVRGIATGDMGRDSSGAPTGSFVPGVELLARQTVFAEGCRGSLSEQILDRFDLRAQSDPQTYGLGIKEVWEVLPEKHKSGACLHTIGWPLDSRTYGGSFVYHYGQNLVSLGFVVGLDYENPYLSPYEEMQRFKTHPAIRPLLEGGRRISYGARALVEGGLPSLPKLCFPGGVLIGDCAGFLNVPRIKGTHTAMKSGMLAADALAPWLENGKDSGGQPCTLYPEMFQKSWLYKELAAVRNIRSGFRYGLWAGLVNAAFETLTWGKAPWTLRHTREDRACLRKASHATPIAYPRPDGVLTFDRLSSVYLSNTAHAEDQPCHLTLKDPTVPVSYTLPEYDEPAQRYCPAGVYEIVRTPDGTARFQINFQNCVHCKACDIKDPAGNIVWTVPQGGDGPNYSGM